MEGRKFDRNIVGTNRQFIHFVISDLDKGKAHHIDDGRHYSRETEDVEIRSLVKLSVSK